MSIQEQIKKAKLQLECAENKFNNASTKNEIDFAIADMIAAETKLDSLIKIERGE